jgi:hypothetical protein
MQVMRHGRRLLLLQHAPRFTVTQSRLLHEFKRLREGDEQGHGGAWLGKGMGGKGMAQRFVILLPPIPLPVGLVLGLVMGILAGA